MPDRSPAASATKIWRKVGMTDSAVAPIIDESIGTSRHPRTTRPSSAQIFSTSSAAAEHASSSAGRNAMPTAYDPASGRSKSTTARRNASGTWTRMPAPSPVFSSAPFAPR